MSGRASISPRACLVSICSLSWAYMPDLMLRFFFFRLEVALKREVEGDLFLQDIGQGFGFRPGSFDGAIR